MSPQQRNRLSEKVADLGNLAAAAMLFGQVLSGKSIDLRAAILGIIAASACYLISFLLLKGE